MNRLILVLFLPIIHFSSIAQCISGDCQNGKGSYVFKSGTKYTGEFKSGKLNGFGTCQFSSGNIYKGDWKDNVREGDGVFQLNNGVVYKGTFKKNEYHGYGEMRFPNGEIFKANWTNGKSMGGGELRKSDGSTVQATFDNGMVTALNQSPGDQPIVQVLPNCNTQFCKNGLGVFVFPDGSKYEGEFLDGFPNGQGTCSYSNGDIYTGDFLNKYPHGEGVMLYSDGEKIQGKWNKGKYSWSTTEPSVDRPEFENSGVNIYAVIVGVARYNNFESLKYTDDDAYRIYAFLRSPEGGAIPDENIKILIDESAVKDNVMKSLNEVAVMTDNDDVIIVYFAGHGINGYYLPFDSDGYQNALDYDAVKKVLAKAEAKQKLCIVDACYSGSLLAAKTPMMESLKLLYDQLSESSGGTAFLMSSKQEEYSLESNGLRQGIFSHFLIKGLKGDADSNRNKIVSLDELFAYVHKEVREYTGNLQTPVLAGDFQENMPLAMIR